MGPQVVMCLSHLSLARIAAPPTAGGAAAAEGISEVLEAAAAACPAGAAQASLDCLRCRDLHHQRTRQTEDWLQFKNLYVGRSEV